MMVLAHAAAMVLNPVVRQATIGDTICRPGWSRSVRPNFAGTLNVRFPDENQ
jgi:hypothetical protein